MVTKVFLSLERFLLGIGLFENSHLEKRTICCLRQLADVPLTQITKRLDHMQGSIRVPESTLDYVNNLL